MESKMIKILLLYVLTVTIRPSLCLTRSCQVTKGRTGLNLYCPNIGAPEIHLERKKAISISIECIAPLSENQIIQDTRKVLSGIIFFQTISLAKCGNISSQFIKEFNLTNITELKLRKQTNQHNSGLSILFWLPELTKLDIANHGDLQLTQQILEKNTKLTHLYISDNEKILIESLLESVQHLFMYNNNLESLEFLKKAPNLETLDLNRNKIEFLKSDFFTNMTKLESLHIGGNKLRSLPAGLLDPLPRLKSFIINCNDFESFPSGLLLHNKNITQFELDNHSAMCRKGGKTRLPDRMFLSPHLLEIKFKDVVISKIPGRWLAGCTGLLTLVMDQCSLEVIPRTIFLETPLLRYLNLNYNRIRTLYFLPRTTREVHLQYNRIDDNALENLSSVNLSKIEVFDISHNQIVTIEALIPISKRSHHLKLLNVSYNNISNLETNNWTVKLDISNNPLFYSNTEVIKQRFVNVTCFSPITFSAWNSSLAAQDCGICECSYNEYEDYVNINCSSRSLTCVPTIEISAKRIKLDLSKNLLKEVSARLPNNVSDLDLSQNFLNNLNIALLPAALENLDLSYNKLSFISEELVFFFNNIKVLKLDHNPLNCERLKSSMDGLNEQLKTFVSEECQTEREIQVLEIVIISSSVTVAITVFVIFKHRESLRNYWTEHLYKSCYKYKKYEDELTGSITKPKYKYEVLMIYNENDLEFVQDHLYSHISSSEQSVCVTSEELPAGGSKPDQMTELIKKSRRVVAIISQYFVSDPWCLLQFTLVMAEKLRDPSTKLLVLLHGNPSLSSLPEDIRVYVEIVSHLKTDSPMLFSKLSDIFDQSNRIPKQEQEEMT